MEDLVTTDKKALDSGSFWDEQLDASSNFLFYEGRRRDLLPVLGRRGRHGAVVADGSKLKTDRERLLSLHEKYGRRVFRRRFHGVLLPLFCNLVRVCVVSAYNAGAILAASGRFLAWRELVAAAFGRLWQYSGD